MIATLPLAVLGITWQVLVDAIGLGAVYALMAVGLTLTMAVVKLPLLVVLLGLAPLSIAIAGITSKRAS